MSRIRRNTQPLADRVSQAETDLSKKANASDLQTLTGRVGTAETNISKKANTTDVAKKCGMPKWSATPEKIIDTGASPAITSATIASDGWLYCYSRSGGNNGDFNPSIMTINGKDVKYLCCHGHGVATAYSGVPVPVSKGDKIAASVAGGVVECYFYPYK